MVSRKLEDNSISIPFKIWFAKKLNALSIILELLHGNINILLWQYKIFKSLISQFKI